MNLSFALLCEQMDKEKRQTPLMDSGEEDKSMIVVRKGNQLRKEDDRPFWDDFIDMCGDAQSLGTLLQIEPQKIMRWPSRIREMLEKLQSHEAENPGPGDRDEVIPTGDNGAFTSNQDPSIGEM